MNIFVNISHPAHVHFFKNALRILSQRGHHIVCGARRKEFTLELLKGYQIQHVVLTQKGHKLTGLVRELLQQQLKIAQILRKTPFDLMLQIGGIFNAPVGRYYHVPTLAFSDTENEKWGNRLSFSLSRHVLLPSCFDPRVGRKWPKQVVYPGYHELAYLSPQYAPAMHQPENKFLLRFIQWSAGHDLGEKGLSWQQKTELVRVLSRFGSVHVSSEDPLPQEILPYAFKLAPGRIHEFMAKCKMVVGESATMTSEAACLGIPTVYISDTGRGYTTEQDRVYGLVKHFRLNQWRQIMDLVNEWACQNLFEPWQTKRWAMLKDKIEVTDWLVDLVENYPQSIAAALKGNFRKYAITCAD